jgi:hypothetical protein
LEGMLRSLDTVCHVISIPGDRPMLKFELNGISFDMLFVSLTLDGVVNLSLYPTPIVPDSGGGDLEYDSQSLYTHDLSVPKT